MLVLFVVIALLQGIPVSPQAAGTVSGVLRDSNGKPAVGVRVSAMLRDDPATGVGALASLTETDNDGKFLLEDIPPGQYYIVAGNLSRPTYFPGTQDVTKARGIQITAGARNTGIDFVVVDPTRPQPAGMLGSPRAQIAARVLPEPGTKLPVHSESGPITLEFLRVSDGAVLRFQTISAPSVSLELLPSPAKTDYRVNVINLPAGFAVKSVTYDNVALPSGILPISTLTGSPPAGTPAFPLLALPSRKGLEITVGEDPSVPRAPAPGGVIVSGIGRRSDHHPVTLSGKNAIVYDDGSFEFFNVPAGRHVIALMDSPGRALGTTVVVGDKDLENVTLDDIVALPVTIHSPIPVANEPAIPGTKLPPVILKGRVLDQMTQEPPPSGQVRISGLKGPISYLEPDGTFEVRGLLPGVYHLELQVAGYPAISRDVTVGFDDINLDLRIAK